MNKNKANNTFNTLFINHNIIKSYDFKYHFIFII